ncbi:tRNA epoxyqueuosine(34) reductase QueG [Candidatus Peregrinibacteria bacterium]|nr:tRNA epoxyqueuosine(34) reductase QueG [Candidatus Peregrinibacteria bacterium]
MYSETMDKHIKQYARSLGFHMVGISPATRLEREKEHLDAWLMKGYEADLAYMKKHADRRTDACQSLPGAKSIICLAMNYYQKRGDQPGDEARAKVARYAWGKDYHIVIEKKLKKIRRFIIANAGKALSKKDFKLYCDAGPILERAHAVRAGLGFIGKNTMLITPRYGSWVFLAEIITTLSLPYDMPFNKEMGCGDCTRCMDACPVKAIVRPYRIDANKCIAYQTIEKKDSVEGRTHGFVFGCDVCQEVCPHNCRAQQTDTKEFLKHRAGQSLNVQRILAMSEEEFVKAYPASPIKRAGLKKLKNTLRTMVSSNKN